HPARRAHHGPRHQGRTSGRRRAGAPDGERRDAEVVMSDGESAQALLEAVTELARLTGECALSHFRDGVAVEVKGDGSPVTIADRAAERAAREWLSRRFPDDGILGEEYGVERPDARRRWILDPIDGTKSFIHGVPLWGTLIAVAEGDDVLAGAINCAAAGELVAAARGA